MRGLFALGVGRPTRTMTMIEWNSNMKTKKAIERILLQARSHHRTWSLNEIDLYMDELEPLRDLIQRELYQAYQKGYRQGVMDLENPK